MKTVRIASLWVLALVVIFGMVGQAVADDKALTKLLIGKWEHEERGDYDVTLSKRGTYTCGKTRGKWKVDDGNLVITVGGKKYKYHFTVGGGKLVWTIKGKDHHYHKAD